MNEFFNADDSKARNSIRDIARDCSNLIIFIRRFAARNGSRWQHHVPAMQRAIEGFQRRCEYELRHLGEWREDYLQPDEIAEDIIRRFYRLTRWLSLMMRD